MSEYICVPKNPYRGADKKKKEKANEENLLALRIEDYLNEIYLRMDAGQVNVIAYHAIARDLSEEIESVRRVASRIDAGGNGITLRKP